MAAPHTNDHSAEPDNRPETLGKQLRRAREACRLSIPSAAASLHLPPRVIVALEEGNFGQFEPVYVRGYLRNYARLLDLAPDPLLESYNLTLAPPAPPAQPQKPDTTKLPRKPVYLLLVAVGLPLLLWGTSKILLEKNAPPPAIKNLPTPPPPDAPAPQPPPSEAAHPPAANLAVASIQPPPAEPVNAPPPATKQPQETQATKSAADAAPALQTLPSQVIGQGPDTIAIRLSASAWVSIRDQSGRRLVYENLPAGTDRRYAGQAPFAVVLGNAPAATVEFNGQAFDLPKGKGGTVVRFTLGGGPGAKPKQ